MSHALSGRPVSVAEFYAFVRSQPREAGRFEMVDGFAVQSMAGANRRHERIAMNGIRIVGNALLGHSGCAPFGPDTYIRIPSGNRRQADFGIDCGDPPDDSLEADRPRLICEVLSKSNENDQFDFLAKIDEYRTIPSLEALVLIDPEQPRIMVHRRGKSGAWIDPPGPLRGIAAVLDRPEWNLHVPLADLYAGLRFRMRPALLWPDQDATDAPDHPS
jgi:Uma2 family endonuclease